MTRTILCAVAVALVAGCSDYDAPRRTTSIRQGAPKPVASDTEKARASQAEKCAQRHVDWRAGTLYETTEEKRMRDAICGPYYRGS
jgi:hypothetical protein